MALSITKRQKELINAAILTELKINSDRYSCDALLALSNLTGKLCADSVGKKLWSASHHSTLACHESYDLVRSMLVDATDASDDNMMRV